MISPGALLLAAAVAQAGADGPGKADAGAAAPSTPPLVVLDGADAGAPTASTPLALVGAAAASPSDGGILSTAPSAPPLVPSAEPASIDDAFTGADAPPVPAAAAAPDAAAAPGVQPRDLVRVRLKDGQSMSGRLVSRAYDGTVVLELGSGAQLRLPREVVDSVVPDERSYLTAGGETWFRDPNRTRYLYGPSAMMLKRNELSFSQAELLASTISWGATDFLSLQAGAAVPLWFIPPLPAAFNLLVAVKAGGSITEQLHLATGAQALWMPGMAMGIFTRGAPILGVLFGTATVGQADAHASLSLGMPFNFMNAGLPGAQVLGAPIVTLSGNYRVSRAAALVSENWVVTGVGLGGSGVVVINTAAVRVMGEKLAADIGLVLLWSERGALVPVPIPWLTFTYNFF